MAQTRQQKEETVKQLADRFQKMKALVFVDYSGLKVKNVEDLRKILRKQEIDYQVVKKTLLKLAFKSAGLENIKLDSLQGQIAIALGYQDEVMPARLLKQFQKENEALTILGGMIEGKYLEETKVLELANLPTREELLTKVVISIKAPLSGIVNVLQGGMRNFINVLSAIKTQKT